MAGILEDPSWKLSTPDLIQQLAALIWLHKGDDHKDLYKFVTGARVAHEMYNRVSGQRELDQYQSECILAIVEYIKKHPRASENELAKEVQKQIELFQAKVENL